MTGCAVLSDDPMLNLGHLTMLPGGLLLATVAATSADPAGRGSANGTRPGAEVVPVLVFEPQTVLLRRATPTCPARDRGVEALIRAGFSRFTCRVALCKPVPGWSLNLSVENDAVLARGSEPVCAAPVPPPLGGSPSLTASVEFSSSTAPDSMQAAPPIPAAMPTRDSPSHCTGPASPGPLP